MKYRIDYTTVDGFTNAIIDAPTIIDTINKVHQRKDYYLIINISEHHEVDY